MQPLRHALEPLFARERERLVLFLPVAMGSGVLCYHDLKREPPLWPFAAAAILLAALGLLVVRRHVAARALCLGACAFAAGLVSAGLQTQRAPPMPALPHKATIVTGVVGAVDRLPEGGTRVTLIHPSLDGGPPLVRHLRIRLRDDDAAADAPDGTTLQIRALLRPPAPPAYPGARDGERDAFFSGLAGSGWALGHATIVAAAARPGLATWWRGVRDRAGDRFMQGLPGSTGTIAATLMVGISSGITSADRAAFVGSGLAHLLAVAGLHVGIVMGFAMAIVRIGVALVPALALRVPGREIAAVAALVAGGIYMMLTGAHLPIIRSFCMAALATLAIATGRRAVSMRGLAIAALMILVLWPSEIIGVSFQMSFSAVACLIAGYEVLRPVFAHLATGGHGRRFALHLLGLATTSAIAGLASAPFAAFAFGQVQSWFVLANMAAVPLTAIWVMPWGIVALLLMPFGLQAAALVPMGWGLDAIIWIGRTVTALPAATFAVPPMPSAGILTLSAGIALLCLLRTRLRLLGAPLIAAGLATPLLTASPDLVVSDDARLIAYPQNGDLMVERKSGASRFTIEADQVLWAIRRDPIKLSDGACTGDACLITKPRGAILLVRTEGAAPDCTGARVIVANFPLRDACPGVPRVDRFTVWRDGAASVRLASDHVVIETDRSWRGARPWVPPPPVPRARARSTLPVAASE